MALTACVESIHKLWQLVASPFAQSRGRSQDRVSYPRLMTKLRSLPQGCPWMSPLSGSPLLAMCTAPAPQAQPHDDSTPGGAEEWEALWRAQSGSHIPTSPPPHIPTSPQCPCGAEHAAPLPPVRLTRCSLQQGCHSWQGPAGTGCHSRAPFKLHFSLDFLDQLYLQARIL